MVIMFGECILFGGSFGGFFFFWIFATPYDIPGQRKKKDTPLDILQKRFASVQITNEEYHEKKIIFDNDLAKQQS